MTESAKSKLQQVLSRWAGKRLISGQPSDDPRETYSPMHFYTGALECLVHAMAEAAVEDGADPQDVMHFLISAARDVMEGKGSYHPSRARAAALAVIRHAERLHPDYEPEPRETARH